MFDVDRQVNQSKDRTFSATYSNYWTCFKTFDISKIESCFRIEIENCPKLLTVALSVIKVDLTHGIPMKDAKFHKQSNFPRSSILYNRLHLFKIIGKYVLFVKYAHLYINEVNIFR